MSDSAPTERVGLPCPSCAPDAAVAHEVLAEGGGYATLRCTECDHVHKEQLPEAEPVERQVVVSQDGESFSATVEAPRGETIERGEEFVLETDEAIMEVRITDLQLDAEERTPRATVEDVETIWTRAVGNVAVPVTVNPGGDASESESETVYLPGDHEFVVGAQTTLADRTVTVTHLAIREDARGYEFAKLDHDGDSALAKDVKRVYARAAGGSDTWQSPW
ncbi:MAG: HVO_0476 family zinc finger protein [Halobacteriaceae archaeon]